MVLIKAKCKSKNKTEMRYEAEWLLECLLLRIKSKAAYEHLRKNNILPLPSKETLRMLLSSLSCSFGFNDFPLDAIKKNLKGKRIEETFGTLMWDEMSLAQDIQFDPDSLQFKGFVHLDDADVIEDDSDEEMNQVREIQMKAKNPY